MRVREFSCELWLPVVREELFPFFADAMNLESITPPWLHFCIVTPRPVAMGQGTLIDYRLRVRGLPLNWRTHISAWEPPVRFVDEQVRGPYRLWVHEHRFKPHGAGTLVVDRVRYATWLDSLAHGWLIRPDIERIFAFRSEALKRKFSADPNGAI